jgi:hypothetical protein
MAYTAITLLELKAALAGRYDGVPWWTETDARQAINEAMRVWNVATGYWRTTTTAPLVPNDIYAVVPLAVSMPTRLTFAEKGLAITSLFDLDHARPGWQGSRGDPWAWVPVSLRLVVVYPATEEIGQSVGVEGLMATPVLTNDADTIDIGAEEQNALLSYALHALSYWRGGEMLVATDEHRMAFWRAAALRNSQLNRSLPLRFSQGRADLQLDPPHGAEAAR